MFWCSFSSDKCTSFYDLVGAWAPLNPHAQEFVPRRLAPSSSGSSDPLAPGHVVSACQAPVIVAAATSADSTLDALNDRLVTMQRDLDVLREQKSCQLSALQTELEVQRKMFSDVASEFVAFQTEYQRNMGPITTAMQKVQQTVAALHGSHGDSLRQ